MRLIIVVFLFLGASSASTVGSDGPSKVQAATPDRILAARQSCCSKESGVCVCWEKTRCCGQNPGP
ncbi:hypothetical protein CDEST_15406 [Colletotrichum destructivum]|uniref:Conotoxin n=1 Tax=Colletotrichum destructivum TaxID=34406 RepID=A0AAX4J4X9_9PEZI|nr:hypothetical protein CDEST_15406 [Colletotrichum destructivum]